MWISLVSSCSNAISQRLVMLICWPLTVSSSLLDKSLHYKENTVCSKCLWPNWVIWSIGVHVGAYGHFSAFLLIDRLFLFIYLFVFHSSRAQNLFRQAMRSPFILFHVVPAVRKVQYEHFSQSELGVQPGPGPGVHGPGPKQLPADPKPGPIPSRLTPESKPGERGSVVVGGIDYSSKRLSKSGPHSNANHQTPSSQMEQNQPYPGSAPIISPASKSTTSTGFTKKVGRKFNVQLRKGERKVPDTICDGHDDVISRMYLQPSHNHG